MKLTGKLSRIGTGVLLIVLAFTSLGLTGCSVYNSGMTLPSPYYLKNRPAYHSRGAEFPFANEAAVLQSADREQDRSQY